MDQQFVRAAMCVLCKTLSAGECSEDDMEELGLRIEERDGGYYVVHTESEDVILSISPPQRIGSRVIRVVKPARIAVKALENMKRINREKIQ